MVPFMASSQPEWWKTAAAHQVYPRSFAESAASPSPTPGVGTLAGLSDAAMHDTLRFWLDRGVDGFRIDVVHLLGKDLDLNDPPICQERVWGHVPTTTSRSPTSDCAPSDAFWTSTTGIGSASAKRDVVHLHQPD